MNGPRDIGGTAICRVYSTVQALVRIAELDWIVVQTNPRCELRACAGIEATGALTYLPMIPALRKRKRGKKAIETSKPMFSRYLFVGLNRKVGMTCDQVRSCDGVEKILAAEPDAPAYLVSAREMELIMEAEKSAQLEKKSVEGQAFEVGDNVVLIAGAFVDCRGQVQDIKSNGESLRVELDVFGRSTNVIVPLDKVALR
ncbi:transcription termination/antitermination protein NusG [Pseudovibrio sp. WM33]|uniref:transcription termination/antitermination protein NusG n=1 Tax=Pseudovibrio sp. WM33 TaxID=1735585 RepID=UPI0007AEA060|nr:transcription termination/antitermination NusG family protein [Pseudovibrio sp. WM33]KZL17509.1 Transcription antitermination protein RfaH [Pseudovibrio sp. WM33]